MSLYHYSSDGGGSPCYKVTRFNVWIEIPSASKSRQ